MSNHKQMRERDRRYKKKQDDFESSVFADLITLAFGGIIHKILSFKEERKQGTLSKSDEALEYGCGAGCGSFILFWVICEFVGIEFLDSDLEPLSWIIVVFAFVVTCIFVIRGYKIDTHDNLKKISARDVAVMEESPFQHINVFSSIDADSEFELEVNKQFQNYVLTKDKQNELYSHINFLEVKRDAFKKLSKFDEVSRIDEEIGESTNEVNKLVLPKFVLPSDEDIVLNLEYSDLYNTFIQPFTDCKNPILTDFFGMDYKIVSSEEKQFLIFGNTFLIVYVDTMTNLKVLRYKDLYTRKYTDTELLEGEDRKGRELYKISYLHENKDGSRDMRYSYANNPGYRYYYYGILCLFNKNVEYYIKITSRSDTELSCNTFEKMTKILLEEDDI